MYIRWSDLFNTGITEIDNQHKKLLNILNKALTLSINSQDSEIDTIFSELMSYAKYHFTYEEYLFEKYNFPNSGQHLKEHNNFKKTIEEMCASAKEMTKSEESIENLVVFLKDWLINHILNSDRKYIKYFPKDNL